VRLKDSPGCRCSRENSQRTRIWGIRIRIKIIFGRMSIVQLLREYHLLLVVAFGYLKMCCGKVRKSDAEVMWVGRMWICWRGTTCLPFETDPDSGSLQFYRSRIKLTLISSPTLPPPTPLRSHDTIMTPPPLPPVRPIRSFDIPASSSSPTPGRSRKSYSTLNSQQQQGQQGPHPPNGRGGSYVTPPMANGRRMTSNPVRRRDVK